MSADRLTRAELGVTPASASSPEPGALEGYWHGGAGAEVRRWRERALRGEAELARLRVCASAMASAS